MNKVRLPPNRHSELHFSRLLNIEKELRTGNLRNSIQDNIFDFTLLTNLTNIFQQIESVFTSENILSLFVK